MTTRRSPMQVTVEAIMQAHGLLNRFREHYASGEYMEVTVHNPPYMRLTIRVIAKRMVTVCHATEFGPYQEYAVDPEITFVADAYGSWKARTYEQNAGMAIYQNAGPGRYLPQANRFAQSWAVTLRDQGFADPSLDVAVYTGEEEEKAHAAAAD